MLRALRVIVALRAIVVGVVVGAGLFAVSAVGSGPPFTVVSAWSVMGGSRSISVGVGLSLLLPVYVSTADRASRSVASISAGGDPLDVTRSVYWVLALGPAGEGVRSVSIISFPTYNASFFTGVVSDVALHW